MTPRGWFVLGIGLGLFLGVIVGGAVTRHDFGTCHVTTLSGSPLTETCVRDLR